MKYILILFMYNGGVDHIYFPNKAACHSAAELVKSAVKSSTLIGVRMDVICVPKGE